MGIYEELQARGLVKQVTNEPEIREMVNAGKAKFYIGFDCTADSLTAGHFMALTLMKRLQMAGNQPVALTYLYCFFIYFLGAAAARARIRPITVCLPRRTQSSSGR